MCAYVMEIFYFVAVPTIFCAQLEIRRNVSCAALSVSYTKYKETHPKVPACSTVICLHSPRREFKAYLAHVSCVPAKSQKSYDISLILMS